MERIKRDGATIFTTSIVEKLENKRNSKLATSSDVSGGVFSSAVDKKISEDGEEQQPAPVTPRAADE